MSGRVPQGGETREEHIGRIVNDYLDRRARGTAEPETELFSRYPEWADELRLQLEVLRDLKPTGQPIESLVAQGPLRCSPDPQYPAQLAAYKITDFLGRGGMGVVLKAYEESLSRTVALKVLRPELAADRSALARFEREAKAAATLHHPNIVTIYAVGEDHGVHFMAMEYIAGPTLADVIRAAYVRTENTSVAAGVSPAGSSSSPVAAGVSPAEWPTSSEVVSRFENGNQSPTFENSAAGPRILSRSLATAESLPPSLPPNLIRDIFRQLLSALAAAHQAGLVHRDIKPANILLDGWSKEGKRQEAGGKSKEATRQQGREGEAPAEPPSLSTQHCAPATQHSAPSTQHFRVKLADFGLARMVSAQTRVTLPSALLGTPEYMSPEQARGEDADGGIDHRADLYSAGVVLYEMLTGRTPFRADTPSAVIHRILHEEPRDPRALYPAADPHLASLALRLMAKRPQDRFASAAEALAALEAGTRIALLEQRRRTRRRAFAAAVLALLAGAGWLAGRPGGPWGRLSSRSAVVRVEVDHVLKCVKLVYANDDKKVFETVPSVAGNVWAAALVNLDGAQERIVVVGLRSPEHEKNLFAFDLDGRERWSKYLTVDTELGRNWPERVPGLLWYCPFVVADNLDDDPGDELLVVADDGDYPTLLCRLDPETGGLESTFWHMGDLAEPQIEPEFFGHGRPAIVLSGSNNKLDGFDDGKQLPDDDAPVAHWDWVPVVMILDPRDMSGVGPPRTGRIPLPQAHVQAYAFLDLPSEWSTWARGERPPPGAEPTAVQLEDVASGLELNDPRAENAVLQVNVLRLLTERDAYITRATLNLDRNLDCVYVTCEHDRVRQTRESWEEVWHVIIPEGQYVEE
ncbi:MAG: serine/threonine-protein kinase [Planctomycetota bacterium]